MAQGPRRSVKLSADCRNGYASPSPVLPDFILTTVVGELYLESGALGVEGAGG